MSESGEQKPTGDLIESFRIQRFDPAQRRNNLLLGLLVLSIVGAALFVSGYSFSRYQADGKLRRDNHLQQQVKLLDKQASELRSRTAGLKQSADLDTMAAQQMQLELNAREVEIAKLKEQLVFYQSLLSPEGIESGLQVQSLSLRQLGDTSNYTYHMVLTFVNADKNQAMGNIEMSINGARSGVAQSLLMADISEQTKESLRYEFKYFQRFEGGFTLPAGFEASDVSIILHSDNKEHDDIKVDIAWDTVLHQLESSLF